MISLFEPWHISFTRIIPAKNKNGQFFLIRFISSSFRTSWLQAKKLKGDLKCSEILNSEPDTLIYFNQRQTAIERHELMEARKIITDKNYPSCWMSDGVILYKETATGCVLKYSNLAVSVNEMMDTSNPATNNVNSQTQDSTTSLQTSTATNAV